MDEGTHPLKVLAVGLSVILLIVVVVPLACAHMEAKTYNKLTGSHVSTWDALWVQLRVTPD